MEDESTLSEELLADFSETVRGVARELDERGPVTASEIAWAIQRRHPEYVDNKFAEIQIDPELGERDSMTSWLNRIRDRYDLESVRATSHHVIDGALTLLALAQLDRDLAKRLGQDDFLQSLHHEIDHEVVGIRPHAEQTEGGPADSLVIWDGNVPLSNVSLSSDGLEMAIVEPARVIRLGISDPRVVTQELALTYASSPQAVLLDSLGVLVVLEDGASRLWKPGGGTVAVSPPSSSMAFDFLVRSGPSGAVGASRDGTICLFIAPDSAWISSAEVEPLASLAGSISDSLLATGHISGLVRVLETDLSRPSPAIPWTVGAHPGPVEGLALSRDGRLASVGGPELRIWLPKLGNVKPLLSITLREFDPRVLEFDQSGDRIAVGGDLGGVLVMNASTGEELFSFNREERVTALAWAPDGRTLYSAGSDGKVLAHELASLSISSAHVDWIHDEPAEHDVLKRKPLAALIALQLRELAQRYPGRSFLVHIDGPWGAGKSSLLNFLDDELKKKQDEPWLISRFDAWRQSKVGPPWLALTSALRETLRNDRTGLRRLRFRAREWARLAGSGRWIALALFILIAGILGFLTLRFGWADPGVAQTAIGLVSGLAAIATLVWSMLKGTTGLLVNSSAKRARDFEESQRDPMDDIAKHFAWLLDRAGKTIVVFIDDLDRCKDTYVVELLDTLQTLMRTAPKVSGKRAPEHADESAPIAPKEPSLIFVVAADGRWIRKSYEKAHEVFIDSVSEPGRPLGYLFLEKLFQVTVELPTLSPSLQQEFLSDLLAVPGSSDQETEAAREEELTERIQQSATESELLGVLQDATPKERVKLSDITVEALSKAPVRKATEHALQKFAGLLEPNPRSMKRFVIAYSIARGVRTVEGSAIGIEPLALWIVIRSRWPAVADYIAQHPEAIELVGKPAEELTDHGVPSHLVTLFEDSDKTFAKVIGFLPDTPFTADVVRECCGTGEAGAKEAES